MTKYINEKQIVYIDKALIQHFFPEEEMRLLSPSALNMIVNLPEQYVFGKPLYPALFDKATIIFFQ